MREHKFRGKRLDNGEWVYGRYSFYLRGMADIKTDIVVPENGDGAEEIVPSTVGQFTGLLDKNGKEIFEGDIVENLTEDIIQKIQYDIETARFVITGEGLLFDFDNTYSTELEVIGTIHDNPELLKQEEL